jgi:hypothetical protein
MTNLVKSKDAGILDARTGFVLHANAQHKDLQHIRSILDGWRFEDQIRRTARGRWTGSGKDSWEERDGMVAAPNADIAISRGEAGENAS